MVLFMRNVQIPKLHEAAMKACRERIDNLTKPLYSLAKLELIAERLAGIIGEERPNHLKHSVVIIGADAAVDGPQNHTHGVESKAAMERLNNGTSAVHGAAKRLQANIILCDAGLELDTSELENVRQVKVTNCPHFFRGQAVLTPDEVEQALEQGFELAEELAKEGYQTIGLGNVGERNLLNALAVTKQVTGYPMENFLEVNSCGLTVQEKSMQLTESLERFGLDNSNPLRIMQCLAGPEVVMMVGLVLGAAMHGMAVVFDNALTGTAIVLASLIDKQVLDYVFPSTNTTDLIQKNQMKYLELTPYLYYNLDMDEAVGSVMGLSILDASLHMLNDMKTFGEADVTVAEDGPGNEKQDGR